MKTKVCSKCKLPKSLDEFGIAKRNPDGKNCYCLKCARDSNALRYHTNPSYREKNKAGAYRRRYGITIEDRAWLFHKQDGKCALCGRSEEEYGRSLHIDHIHGLVGPSSIRGLLCDFCNGYFITWVERFPQLMNDFVRNYLTRRPLLERMNESH